MSRHIDAEWLKAFFEADKGKDRLITIDILLALIDAAPSIDIVFCKECKWDKAQTIPKSVKCIYQHNPDDFCSYGERREP